MLPSCPYHAPLASTHGFVTPPPSEPQSPPVGPARPARQPSVPNDLWDNALATQPQATLWPPGPVPPNGSGSAIFGPPAAAKRPLGRPLTALDLSRPDILRGVMKRLAAEHDQQVGVMHSSAVQEQDPYTQAPFKGLSPEKLGGVALCSLAARRLWVQRILAAESMFYSFVDGDIRPDSIRCLDGAYFFTNPGPFSAVPVLESLASIEFHARWPAWVADELALPAYLGREPLACEKRQLRLMRARRNCDHYVELCLSAPAKSSKISSFLARLMQDDQDIPSLPPLIFA